MIFVEIIITICNAISLLAGGRGGRTRPVPDPQIQEAPSSYQEEAIQEEGPRVFLKCFSQCNFFELLVYYSIMT